MVSFESYSPSGKVPILLDTDIGPDCDDAGAVAILHTLERMGLVKLIGMLHCTSNRWGAGCLDALNSYYGRGNIPIGTLRRQPGFLDDETFTGKYNRSIAQNYPNRYSHGNDVNGAPDAVDVARELLAKAQDGTVVVVAIGPLVNLVHLLQSGPDQHSVLQGIALVARKVRQLVVMGGRFPKGVEWNFEMHPVSAAYVAEEWPTPIMFAGFEIGAALLTGRRLFTDLPADHPVRLCYKLWHDGEEKLRESWDLAAALYAAEGAGDYWDVVRGRIQVNAGTGANHWIADEEGTHSYLIPKMDTTKLTDKLDELLVRTS